MFTFLCTPDAGEPFEVKATSRAITRWESAGRGRSVSSLTENMRMTDLVDLAWFAADRAGKTQLDIAQWRDQVDIDAKPSTDDDDDEEGPTRKAL